MRNGRRAFALPDDARARQQSLKRGVTHCRGGTLNLTSRSSASHFARTAHAHFCLLSSLSSLHLPAPATPATSPTLTALTLPFLSATASPASPPIPLAPRARCCVGRRLFLPACYASRCRHAPALFSASNSQAWAGQGREIRRKASASSILSQRAAGRSWWRAPHGLPGQHSVSSACGAGAAHWPPPTLRAKRLPQHLSRLLMASCAPALPRTRTRNIPRMAGA